MEASSSKRKCLDGSLDRISSLPEDVLLHIMSFLDTKEAVLTGILSSRWKGLWSFSPKLTFNDHHFDKDDEENDGRNFIKFMERSLSLHVAPKISSLFLCISYDEDKREYYDSALNSVIDLAILKGAEEIHLLVHAEDSFYEVPPALFQCDRLVSLSLRCCDFELSTPVRFSSLVRLYLSFIVSDCENIQKVLDGCPLLEDLVIFQCQCFGGHLRIRSSSYSDLPLKRVAIEQFHGGDDPNPSLEIHAPNLQFLKLTGYNCDISLKGLSSLSEASLDLWFELEQLPIMEQLLKDLSHVKHLQLSNRCIQVMSVATLQGLHSYIPKTKCLLLETEALRCEVRGIANLLWSSHNIETLIINFTPPVHDLFDCTINHEGSNFWDALTLSFPCFIRNLKIIKITGFMQHRILIQEEVRNFADNLPSQMALAKFLLKSAMVLKKMIVQFSERPSFFTVEGWMKMKLMAIETLKRISRASPSAELLFL